MRIQLRNEVEGYSVHNPAIIALKYALENKEQLAQQLGGTSEIDLESFLDYALLLEPEKGHA